ncbi:MAG TPA: hypothetical protein VKR54_04700 [Candidatus Babeliales bacterium]|jgi:hypothetical protein|nr:hypothetical protein [Candidatus Babeliales bacterium]
MHNKITFHIALYCLLATANVVAMEKEQLTLQPNSFYIETGNQEYFLLGKDGSTREKIAANIISDNMDFLDPIPLVKFYNQELISDSQYKYLEKNTKGFTQSINIKYCGQKNIISKVSVIPTYRIYTPSEESTNKWHEIRVNGSLVEIQENLLANNEQKNTYLSCFQNNLSFIQLQMLNKLIEENKNVYTQRQYSNSFYRIFIKKNPNDSNPIVQTNTKENNLTDKRTPKSTHKTKIKSSSISSFLTKYLTKRTVLRISLLIGLILAAYKYNKLDGFIKFA